MSDASTDTYGCACLNFCGDDPAVIAGKVRRCDWSETRRLQAEREMRVADAAPVLLAVAHSAWACIAELPATPARCELARQLQDAIELAGEKVE